MTVDATGKPPRHPVDRVMSRHRWLLGQLRKMAAAYGRFADAADQDGHPEDAKVYRRVQRRLQNLLDKRDLEGRPVRNPGEAT